MRAKSPELSSLRRFVPLLAAALLLVTSTTCSKEKKSATPASGSASAPSPAVSDTSAIKSAVAVADTTARLAAFNNFLSQYPNSTFRANALAQVVGILGKKSPEQADAFVQEHLKSETNPASVGLLYYFSYVHARDHQPDAQAGVIEALLKDPRPDSQGFNDVAWDLVDHNTDLDDAIKLADTGYARAADSTSKGSILDTKGWACYQKADYPAAVQALESAAAYQPDEEIRGHLAKAYEKAGRAKDARDVYADLLVSQEDPEMRAKVKTLTQSLHGSVPEVFGRIDAQRKANARPAPDFALKDWNGSTIHLADFRGKIVMLDFWHPT